MEQQKWIERHFELGIPDNLLVCILERLRGTPARIEELVRGIPAADLIRRANEAWSIQEHIGHLYDLEEIHEGRIDDLISRLANLRAADVTNRKTWEANYNSASNEQLIASVRSARMKFVRRIEALDEDVLRVSAVHPRLKSPMRIIDMSFFIAEHDDHHLAVMRRLV